MSCRPAQLAARSSADVVADDDLRRHQLNPLVQGERDRPRLAGHRIVERAVLTGAVGPVVADVAPRLRALEKGAAEAINPTAEDAFWRENYRSRPYVPQGSAYDEFAPAYRYGWESRSRYSGRRFEEVESDLGRNWDRARGDSSLTWDRAKLATRDSWHRVSDAVERATPGDSDHDGK